MKIVRLKKDETLAFDDGLFRPKELNVSASGEAEFVLTMVGHTAPSFDMKGSEIEEVALRQFREMEAMAKITPINFGRLNPYPREIERLLKGTWKVNSVKSKTRYITFTFKNRLITLCGKNNGNKIEVGYSVYCDSVLDKRKKYEPENKELSKRIALGRLSKTPMFSMTVSEEAHRFVDTALDVVRTKILKGELIIKGIR